MRYRGPGWQDRSRHLSARIQHIASRERPPWDGMSKGTERIDLNLEVAPFRNAPCVLVLGYFRKMICPSVSMDISTLSHWTSDRLGLDSETMASSHGWTCFEIVRDPLHAEMIATLPITTARTVSRLRFLLPVRYYFGSYDHNCRVFPLHVACNKSVRSTNPRGLRDSLDDTLSHDDALAIHSYDVQLTTSHITFVISSWKLLSLASWLRTILA